MHGEGYCGSPLPLAPIGVGGEDGIPRQSYFVLH